MLESPGSAQIIPPAKFSQSAAEVEAKLREQGIPLEPESHLERMLCHAHEIEHLHEVHRSNMAAPECQAAYAEALAVEDFRSKLWAGLSSSNVETLKPHLALLSKADFAQNKSLDREDQGANKVFELYVACLIAPVVTHLKVDPPNGRAVGAPDLQFRFREQTWAIECKCPYSNNPKSVGDLIEKAVDQIQKSPAQRGLVALNVKNIFPHSRMWIQSQGAARVANNGPFPRGVDAMGAALERLQELLDSIRLARSDDSWEELFQGKKCDANFAIPLQTVAAVIGPGKSWGVCQLTRTELVGLLNKEDLPRPDLKALAVAINRGFERPVG